MIAETPAEIDTLSVSEVVMCLDFSEQSALVFPHPGNGSINVMYGHRDGNIGRVDPEPANASD